MSKAKAAGSDLRREYKLSDFKAKGVRGKYLKSYRAGTNLALLDSDVAAVFTTDKAVNDALRVVMTAAVSTPRSQATRVPRVRARAARDG